MAEQYPLTIPLALIVGPDVAARSPIVTVRTNLDGIVTDTDSRRLHVGDGRATVSGDVATVSLLQSDGAGTNVPSGWSYWLDISVSPTPQHGGGNGGDRVRRTLGPFVMPGAPTNIIDLAGQFDTPATDPVWRDGFRTEMDAKQAAAQSARAGAEAARDAAEALVISDLGTTDGQTRALIEAPASQTAQALSATIGTAVNAPKVFRLDTFNGFFEGETSADNPAIWDNSTHLNDAGLTDWAEWIVATAAAAGAFAKPNPKVVWLGDSWIYQGRVSILAAATTAVIPGATVVVSGVPGDTSTALLARFDADVPADADVVIFNEPGVNDAAGANLSVAAQLANLAELVRQIRALGATPVFTGHVPLADYPRAAPMNAAIGRVIGDGTAFPGTDAQGSWTANVTQPRPDALGLGPDALAALTEGSQVYAIGQNAAAQLATASHVVAIGGAALYSLTTGGENTAIGGNAGFNATTGTGNTFIGKGAGFTTTTGSEQVAIGYNAVCLPAAAAATAIGTASEAGNYLATAVGAYTKALHIGSVAIGVDNTYAGATTTANNDFVLGTANHRYRMPGLPTAAPAAASGILWNDGGVVKVA